MPFDHSIPSFQGQGHFRIFEPASIPGTVLLRIQNESGIKTDAVTLDRFNLLTQEWLEHQGYLVVAPPKDSELA